VFFRSATLLVCCAAPLDCCCLLYSAVPHCFAVLYCAVPRHSAWLLLCASLLLFCITPLLRCSTPLLRCSMPLRCCALLLHSDVLCLSTALLVCALLLCPAIPAICFSFAAACRLVAPFVFFWYVGQIVTLSLSVTGLLAGLIGIWFGRLRHHSARLVVSCGHLVACSAQSLLLCRLIG